MDEWQVRGIPLTCLLRNVTDAEREERHIQAAGVQLLRQGGVVRPFMQLPEPEERSVLYQGPVQYWGEAASAPGIRMTWYMETQPIQDPTDVLQDIGLLCSELQSTMAVAKAESTLYAVNRLLSTAGSLLDAFNHLESDGRGSLADVPLEKTWKAVTTKR